MCGGVGHGTFDVIEYVFQVNISLVYSWAQVYTDSHGHTVGVDQGTRLLEHSGFTLFLSCIQGDNTLFRGKINRGW